MRFRSFWSCALRAHDPAVCHVPKAFSKAQILSLSLFDIFRFSLFGSTVTMFEHKLFHVLRGTHIGISADRRSDVADFGFLWPLVVVWNVFHVGWQTSHRIYLDPDSQGYYLCVCPYIVPLTGGGTRGEGKWIHERPKSRSMCRKVSGVVELFFLQRNTTSPSLQRPPVCLGFIFELELDIFEVREAQMETMGYA